MVRTRIYFPEVDIGNPEEVDVFALGRHNYDHDLHPRMGFLILLDRLFMDAQLKALINVDPAIPEDQLLPGLELASLHGDIEVGLLEYELDEAGVEVALGGQRPHLDNSFQIVHIL
jgi:hypothetical protein